jgi:hypothetical protein
VFLAPSKAPRQILRETPSAPFRMICSAQLLIHHHVSVRWPCRVGRGEVSHSVLRVRRPQIESGDVRRCYRGQHRDVGRSVVDANPVVAEDRVAQDRDVPRTGVDAHAIEASRVRERDQVPAAEEFIADAGVGGVVGVDGLAAVAQVGTPIASLMATGPRWGLTPPSWSLRGEVYPYIRGVTLNPRDFLKRTGRNYEGGRADAVNSPRASPATTNRWEPCTRFRGRSGATGPCQSSMVGSRGMRFATHSSSCTSFSTPLGMQTVRTVSLPIALCLTPRGT